MTQRIDSDRRRFREIVRGRIKRNLKQYISQGELIGKQGDKTVSIPVPSIDIPRFKFGTRQNGGMGQGDGEPGDAIGQQGEGSGQGEAGDSPGEHVLEVDVELEELAKILGEELELPNIEPKGERNIVAKKDRYNRISSQGPDSLRHFRRTYREALKRQITAGAYNPRNPTVVPIPKDQKYRSWKEDTQPERNAVIIYMMDVSGSMGDEQKEIVRMEAFWIDTWLSTQYDGLQTRYIIHDAAAREVDRETFFHTRESGGTLIST
ncbi:MAG: DUF444 family protein, partial [Myxococcota bacterium]|nr:DUF444 family protein [Myxococcota bacterium]